MKIRILKGSPCRVVKVGSDWRDPEMVLTHETEHDHDFSGPDLVFDPLNRGWSKRHLVPHMIKAEYAMNGYYGVEKNGWIMVVHESFVQDGGS